MSELHDTERTDLAPLDPQRCTSEPVPGPASAEQAPRRLRRTLAVRDFRLLLGGATTSLLGDQFALIATPWLVLQLTGDPLALGLVLALEGIPRAAFMLVGGAVTDRLAPRRVMLLADILRGALVTAMAAVVLSGAVEMWMVYGFAAGFGLIAGVAVPAENSIVPTILRRDDLQSGNALMMGVAQVAGFVGPTLAGAVIALRSEGTSGVGIAYLIDAATFAVSAMAFALMRTPHPPRATSAGLGLVASIGVGLRHIWADQAIRFVVGVLAIVNLLVVGPLLVGIPLLAHGRLASSAAAFGLLMGSFAIGNLVGLVVAGTTRPLSSRTMQVVVLGFLGAFGFVVASLGFVVHLGLDVALLAVLGAGNGYLAITMFTWVQGRTPPELLGRTISVVTFAGIGLVSASQAASGLVARWDLDALFAISGLLVLATTAWVATRPGLRAFADSLTGVHPEQANRHRPRHTTDSYPTTHTEATP